MELEGSHIIKYTGAFNRDDCRICQQRCNWGKNRINCKFCGMTLHTKCASNGMCATKCIERTFTMISEKNKKLLIKPQKEEYSPLYQKFKNKLEGYLEEKKAKDKKEQEKTLKKLRKFPLHKPKKDEIELLSYKIKSLQELAKEKLPKKGPNVKSLLGKAPTDANNIILGDDNDNNTTPGITALFASKRDEQVQSTILVRDAIDDIINNAIDKRVEIHKENDKSTMTEISTTTTSEEEDRLMNNANLTEEQIKDITLKSTVCSLKSKNAIQNQYIDALKSKIDEMFIYCRELEMKNSQLVDCGVDRVFTTDNNTPQFELILRALKKLEEASAPLKAKPPPEENSL